MEEKDLKQIKTIVTEAVQAGTEEIAQLVAKGFLAVDERFEEVNQEIGEVKDTLRVIEAKVNKALNIEYVRLEKRLKLVEQKLGIKVSAEIE